MLVAWRLPWQYKMQRNQVTVKASVLKWHRLCCLTLLAFVNCICLPGVFLAGSVLENMKVYSNSMRDSLFVSFLTCIAILSRHRRPKLKTRTRSSCEIWPSLYKTLYGKFTLVLKMLDKVTNVEINLTYLKMGLSLCLVFNLGAIRGRFRRAFGSVLFAVLFLHL